MMWGNNFWGTGWPNFNFFWVFPWIIIFVALELVLKGFALWYAARRGQKGWFIAILVINTLGILPLIYLLLYKDKKAKKSR